MKTLVFSDSHLGAVFEKKKYIFLKKLIESSDSVIINGDFWDGYLITFEKFLRSPWSKLFPILKNKKTVYVYGNHDRKAFSNSKVSLFSIKQTEKYQLKTQKQTYVFEHGNHPLPSIDDRIRLPKKALRISTNLYTRLEKILTRTIRGTTRLWGIFLNGKLKKQIRNKKGFFVFGHTHFAEIDVANRFANSGFVQHGLAQYLLIENGVISPKQEWYE